MVRPGVAVLVDSALNGAVQSPVQPNRKGRRLAFAVIGVPLAIVLALGVVAYRYLAASLPRLSGQLVVDGLRSPVKIERDRDGVPTIRAEHRNDLSFAIGFLHGQERFFQMDLLRRAGAGELAALLGPSVLPVDRARRRHRFRARAKAALTGLRPEERSALQAYTRGVRAGLGDLRAKPFEYVLLGTSPEPWRDEDAFCAALAMFFTLQDSSGQSELRRSAIEKALPAGLAKLVLSPGTRWDAAIDGSQLDLPELPDLGAVRPSGGSEEPPEAPIPGSNNWAVDGRRSVHGGAILADDMHLRLRMPNIWFRARQVVTGTTGYDVTGVTLPGTPLLIAGSNGKVAWGFTNSNVDTSDLVVIEPGPEPDTYLTSAGPVRWERFIEKIEVRGAAAESLEVLQTKWGPIVGRDLDGRQVALRWTAHEPNGNDFGLAALVHATTIEQAVAAAHDAGMPNQNVLIASDDGRIAWTLSGLIPTRPAGCDGERPTSWADGRCEWTGFAEPSEVPTVLDPADGRLWTANNRIVGHENRRAARYRNPAHGARADQIRRGLYAKDRLSEKDLLEIQLDDRALFLESWRQLMLTRLQSDENADLRRAVDDWGGRAAPDSVGFRVVRAFRTAVMDRVVNPVLAPARRLVDEAEGVNVWSIRPRNIDHLVWTVVDARVPNLLPAGSSSWDALLDAAVGDVRRKIDEQADGVLAGFTWGAANTLAIEHPLSGAVPLLSTLIDPPGLGMPGDRFMPRVQSPVHGASERFVVSPGRESEGIFHMPGGQASHPLSPYLHAGHDAWVEGRPTPFLPGATEWTLELTPGSS